MGKENYIYSFFLQILKKFIKDNEGVKGNVQKYNWIIK